jgi:hypothetical protein
VVGTWRTKISTLDGVVEGKGGIGLTMERCRGEGDVIDLTRANNAQYKTYMYTMSKRGLKT